MMDFHFQLSRFTASKGVNDRIWSDLNLGVWYEICPFRWMCWGIRTRAKEADQV